MKLTSQDEMLNSLLNGVMTRNLMYMNSVSFFFICCTRISSIISFIAMRNKTARSPTLFFFFLWLDLKLSVHFFTYWPSYFDQQQNVISKSAMQTTTTNKYDLVD